MLLTLILFVALLAIAMMAMAPILSQQIKRDREDELIHRGVQYSRAIKHFVKKFSRYPTKLEDLENTNNIRFLRKRYKDPITGKDFKLLHMGEVQASFGSGLAGATSAAGLAATSQFGGPSTSSAFSNGSSFGASGGSVFSAANSGSSFGSSSNAPEDSGPMPSEGSQVQGAGTDAGTASQKVLSQPSQSDSLSNKVFGGGPIVGVASLSKEKSIRVFNKKEHYYQWQFIYDPTSDSGGLLSTPNQPGLQSAGGLQQGMQGQPGTQSSPFGTQGSAFGQSSPFGPQGATISPGGMQPTPSQPQPQGPQSSFPPEQGPQQ